jgi:predicted Rossmann fold flavoprotein
LVKTKSAGIGSGITKQKTVAVIGAGAAGILAACAAADAGARILLFDGNDRAGRKICATGNGKCNIANRYRSDSCYYTDGTFDRSSFFAPFPEDDLLALLRSEGVLFHERGGCIYPRTDMALTVVSALENMLQKRGVVPILRTKVCRVEDTADKTGFALRLSDGQVLISDAVILATGGAAAPRFGSTGDGYAFAEAYGHHVIDPLPALTKLRTSDPFLRYADGVRADAAVTMLCGGRPVRTEIGELQIAGGMLSGIPVFQLSRIASRALHDGTGCTLRVDFLPEIGDREWESEVGRRLSQKANLTIDTLMLSLAPPRVISMLAQGRGLTAENRCGKLPADRLRPLFDDLRQRDFAITGTGSFEDSQVTCGGIPLSETGPGGESRIRKGLFFAGEILDVDGICGGYNLSFAMCSGYMAGRASACCS